MARGVVEMAIPQKLELHRKLEQEFMSLLA